MSSSDLAFNYFKSEGWSDFQAAAIIGNLHAESGLETNVYGDSGSAYGIAQWRGKRQTQFQTLYGRSLQGSSFQQQLSFVNWELKNTERRAGGMLANSTNLNQATYAVVRGYERPKNDSSYGSRLASAAKVLGGKALGAVAGFATGGPAGAATSVLSGLTGMGGPSYLEQFRAWLSESHFWQRIAIGILAIVLILGALYIIGNKATNNA